MGRRSIVIEVPGDVDRLITPNAHRATHWSKKAAAKQQAKSDTIRVAQAIVGTGRVEPYFTGRVVVSVTRGIAKGRQTMDPDNLTASLKFYLDALREAKVFEDDKRRLMDLDKPVEVRDPSGVGFIRFQITEAA